MKYIKEFGTDYSVTIDGEVVSHKKGIAATLVGGSCGEYRSYSLCKNGVAYQRLGHRLVAETYIDNTENKQQVNHIDGNKRNNAVSNLEWATRFENMRHAVAAGLWTEPTKEHYARMRQNAGAVLAKFTKTDAENINAIYASMGRPSCRRIAKAYKVSKATIQRIVAGQRSVFKGE